MQPNVMVIVATHEEDVMADRADLLVTVQGSSLVTGQAALRKAREVSELVAALAPLGVGQEDISLESVHAQVASGMLGKSSAATYRLRVQCRDLEQLPSLLGAVTSARNATLEALQWRYPAPPGQTLRWLQHCIAQACARAQAAATALGVRLVGVHRLTEESLDTRRGADTTRGYGEDGSLKRARVDLGFELNHHKRTGLKVTVEFQVDGFDPPAI